MHCAGLIAAQRPRLMVFHRLSPEVLVPITILEDGKP